MIIEEIHDLTHRVRHFVGVSESPFDFIPGQFITLHFHHQQQTLRRSYSIASIAGQTTQIEFAAAYVEQGPGSAFLFALKPGDRIQFSGPFGRLIIPPTEPEQVLYLISTGTGVTPYRSMLATLAKQTQICHIIQGIPHRHDAIYHDDFMAYTTPHLHYHLCLSREHEVQHPYEFSGYVQQRLQQLKPQPERDWVLLCGNPDMIDETFTQLTQLGFASKQIKREKYISPKTPSN